ncbi:hypothetical protein ACROYT_G014735 [Oculina patagonica]
MGKDSPDVFYDVETEEKEYDHNENEQEEVDEDVEEDDDNESSWIRDLKSDHIHKEVMATLRRYMDDDDMDFEKAVEAAVNKRKFLLNRVFEPIEIPDESPDEEADDVRRHPLAKW